MKKAKNYRTDDLFYPTEVHIIKIIDSYHEITTTKLTKALGITKGAVLQTTNKLLEKKLIIKSATKEKTNKVLISLSKKGKVVFSYYKAICQKGNCEDYS